MSQDVKRVKILTLVELFVGVVLIIVGLAMFIGSAVGAQPLLLVGEGVATLFLGVRGALIANVPARLGRLLTLAAIILLVQVACVVAIVLTTGTDNLKDNLLPLVASAVPALLSLVIVVLSRGITKRAER